MEYLAEFVATGELPGNFVDRQDMIAAEQTGIKYRLVQQVHRFPQRHETSVCWAGEKGSERLHHSPPPYVCMTN